MSKKQTLLIILFISPLIFFGYTADDRQHVMQNYLLNEESFWRNIEIIVQQIVNMDRLFPLHIILYNGAFKLFDYDNAFVYHGIQIILNIIAYRSFAKWCKLYFDIELDSRALLVFLTTMQFRITYSDPVVSYFGLMQFIAIAQFEGMCFLKKYVDKGGKEHIVKWTMLLIAQLLLYEITLFMAAIWAYYLYMNRRVNYERYKIAMISGMALIALYLILYLKVKRGSTDKYSGTNLSLDFLESIKTVIIESFGSMPLSYVGYLASQKLGLNEIIVWGVYSIFIGALIYFILRCKKEKQEINMNGEFIKYGIMVWILSAASISFSKRYQVELSMGLTYIVSYMQSFGYVMIVLYLIKKYKCRNILIGVCALTFILNILTLNESMKIDGGKRIAIEILTNERIKKEMQYESLIINEKIMQDENLFRENISGDVQNVSYIKVSELYAHKKISQESLIGIAIVQAEHYNKTVILIGEYNGKDQRITKAKAYTGNLKIAEEILDKYNGTINKIQTKMRSEVYEIIMKDDFTIDDSIKKKYR